MQWSFRLVRIFGTDVKVHLTFLLLVGYYALDGYKTGGEPEALFQAAFTLALFACVLLHEFGHILMARRYGIRTPDVILLPIGGLARLERLPEQPRQEFWVAIAGPAVTLAIAAGLWFWVQSTGGIPEDLGFSTSDGRSLVVRLMVANIWLLGFNLIPAYPMDGGRMLRALLASRMGMVRGTRIAARVGQLFAVIGGVVALVWEWPMLGLIALFVFFTAGQEAGMVETSAVGKGIIIDQMMITRYVTIAAHATLRDAVQLLLDGEQAEFPVLGFSGAVEGLLTRDNLTQGLATLGPDSTVRESMTRPVPLLPLGLDFDTALRRLRGSGLPALPVVDANQQLVGLLTLANVHDLILVRQAVAKG